MASGKGGLVIVDIASAYIRIIVGRLRGPPLQPFGHVYQILTAVAQWMSDVWSSDQDTASQPIPVSFSFARSLVRHRLEALYIQTSHNQSLSIHLRARIKCSSTSARCTLKALSRLQLASSIQTRTAFSFDKTDNSQVPPQTHSHKAHTTPQNVLHAAQSTLIPSPRHLFSPV